MPRLIVVVTIAITAKAVGDVARVRQRVSVPCVAIAQLGERQTEDTKVPSSILGHGTAFFALYASMTTTIRRDTSVSGETPPKIQKVTLSRPFQTQGEILARSKLSRVRKQK